MTGNFDEFLNSNRLRKYPFEDSATLAGSGGVYLPKEWIVDCRVVIQSPMVGLVYLQSVDFTTNTVVFADSVTLEPLARGQLDYLPGNEPHVYLKTLDNTLPAGVMTMGMPGGCELSNGTLGVIAFAKGLVTFEPEAVTLVPSAVCVIESSGVRGVRLSDGTIHGLGQRSLSLVPDGVFSFTTDEQSDFIGLNMSGAAFSETTLLERCNPADPAYQFIRRRIQRVVFEHTGASTAVTPFKAVRVTLNDAVQDGVVALADRNGLMASMSPCPSDGLPDSLGNLPDTRACEESDPAPADLVYGAQPANAVIPIANGGLQIVPAVPQMYCGVGLDLTEFGLPDQGSGVQPSKPAVPGGGGRLEIGIPWAEPAPATNATRPTR